MPLSLIDRYRDRYATIGYRENNLYDDVPDMISTLADRDFELGVCTSKRADYAAKIIEMFHLHEYFSFVDGGDIHIKKYMQLERLISNGIDPETTVMIGDRAVDIEAARTNGIRAVGVSWGFGNIEELNNARPDHIVDSPAELVELFS
jgi:phosphoglycolate phosphatase